MVRHDLNIRNSEWVGSPHVSGYGQGFKRSLNRLINEPPPVVAHNVRNGAVGFRNRFGATVNPTTIPHALVAASQLRDYTGQIPLSSMRLIKKPRPWG